MAVSCSLWPCAQHHMGWYPCPRCHTSYSQGAPHFAHPTLYFGTPMPSMPCAFDTPCPVHPVPGHPTFLCTPCQKIPHPGCPMPRTPHFLTPCVFGTLYSVHLAPWAPWPQTWMALLTCPLVPNPCLPLVAPSVLGSHADYPGCCTPPPLTVPSALSPLPQA